MREYRLFPRQAEAERPLTGGSYVLNWDMRLGKTRACLHAFDRLWQAGGPQVAIVVCPSIAKGVWAHEQQDMGLQLPIIKLDGTVNKRATGERIRGLPLLLIVNWDIVDAHLAELLELVQRERVVLILDETHDHCCNPRNQRYKAVKDLATFADRVWICTGTLYRTTALDLHWQLRLLGPSNYPHYYDKLVDFGARFSFPRYNRWSKRDEYKGIRNEEQLLADCAHVIDRRLEELEQLPEDFVWWLDEGEKWRYTGGDDQGAMSRARAELSELKAQRTVELVKRMRADHDEPLVIFGWHRRFTHRVATELGGQVIDGDTPAPRKDQIVADFRAGAVRTVVVNIKSGGVAIDLAAARHAVFGEVDWVAANMSQAEARIRGPRQRHRVAYTYVLCSDSVDEFVWRTMLGRDRDMRRLDSHLAAV
jgi:superfamily II DNA or RNA helicase